MNHRDLCRGKVGGTTTERLPGVDGTEAVIEVPAIMTCGRKLITDDERRHGLCALCFIAECLQKNKKV